MTEGGWEHFEVEADVGVRGWGPSRAVAVAQLTLGVFSLIAAPGSVEARERRDPGIGFCTGASADAADASRRSRQRLRLNHGKNGPLCAPVRSSRWPWWPAAPRLRRL